jgi:SAM-dependent methyltransferase
MTDSDCCPPARDPRIAARFDQLTEERTKGGVLPEMQPTTRRLFKQLSDVGQLKPTILEAGCGSGALLVQLLESGAIRAEGVDLSKGSLAAASRRAEAAGVSDRATFTQGDAARLALAQHDWVVLDRVICCYPDFDALLANTIPAAGRRFAFSVPTSRGLRGLMNRLIWALEARWETIRNGCPGYVHSVDEIESRLRQAGLQLRSSTTGWIWYVAVWERAAA